MEGSDEEWWTRFEVNSCCVEVPESRPGFLTAGHSGRLFVLERQLGVLTSTICMRILPPFQKYCNFFVLAL